MYRIIFMFWAALVLYAIIAKQIARWKNPSGIVRCLERVRKAIAYA